MLNLKNSLNQHHQQVGTGLVLSIGLMLNFSAQACDVSTPKDATTVVKPVAKYVPRFKRATVAAEAPPTELPAESVKPAAYVPRFRRTAVTAEAPPIEDLPSANARASTSSMDETELLLAGLSVLGTSPRASFSSPALPDSTRGSTISGCSLSTLSTGDKSSATSKGLACIRATPDSTATTQMVQDLTLELIEDALYVIYNKDTKEYNAHRHRLDVLEAAKRDAKIHRQDIAYEISYLGHTVRLAYETPAQCDARRAKNAIKADLLMMSEYNKDHKYLLKPLHALKKLLALGSAAYILPDGSIADTSETADRMRIVAQIKEQIEINDHSMRWVGSGVIIRNQSYAYEAAIKLHYKKYPSLLCTDKA